MKVSNFSLCNDVCLPKMWLYVNLGVLHLPMLFFFPWLNMVPTIYYLCIKI